MATNEKMEGPLGLNIFTVNGRPLKVTKTASTDDEERADERQPPADIDPR